MLRTHYAANAFQQLRLASKRLDGCTSVSQTQKIQNMREPLIGNAPQRLDDALAGPVSWVGWLDTEVVAQQLKDGLQGRSTAVGQDACFINANPGASAVLSKF